jgi:ankyrin repeat protein
MWFSTKPEPINQALWNSVTCFNETSVESIEALLNKGANVNSENCFGETPIFFAAYYQHLAVVKTLLETNRVDINKRNKDLKTVLFTAVENSDLETVKIFLKAGAKVNLLSQDGESPLLIAARHGAVEIVKLLLESGADVNLANDPEYLPVAVVNQPHNRKQKNNKIIIKLLTEAAAQKIFNAVKKGDILLLESLLRYKPYVELTNQNGSTPIFVAAKENKTSVVQLLINFGANLNKENNNGITPLLVAANKACVDLVTLLIKNGANVETLNKKEAALLSLSNRIKDQKLRNTLQEFGINLPAAPVLVDMFPASLLRLEIPEIPEAPETPKTAEIIQPIPRVVLPKKQQKKDKNKNLLKPEPKNVKKQVAKSVVEITSLELFFFAVEKNSLTLLVKLLKEGVNVNAINNVGHSALFIAAKNGHEDVVKILLGAGADVNFICKARPTDEKGITSLLKAIIRKHVNVVELLLTNKANPYLGCNALILTQTFKNNKEPFSVEALQYEKIEKKISSYMKVIENLFACAVKENNLNTLRDCLNRGVSPDFLIGEAKTPALWLAALKGHVNIVQALLDAGAERDRKFANRTPLDIAIRCKREEVVALLQETKKPLLFSSNNYQSISFHRYNRQMLFCKAASIY